MSNNRYLASCAGKIGYDCRASALKVIDRRRARKKNPFGRKNPDGNRIGALDTYRCRYCSHWHIGRQG